MRFRLAAIAVAVVVLGAGSQAQLVTATGGPNIVRGRSVTDTSGNVALTFSPAFATAPAVTATPEGAATVSCLVAAVSATAATINCATISYTMLGGSAVRSSASGVTIAWHAIGL